MMRACRVHVACMSRAIPCCVSCRMIRLHARRLRCRLYLPLQTVLRVACSVHGHAADCWSALLPCVIRRIDVLASRRLHAASMLHVVRRMLCCLLHAVRCNAVSHIVRRNYVCCMLSCTLRCCALQDVWHKVVATDTLVGIALRYGITVDAIRRANHLQGVRRQTTSSAA